jgi:eukaryotic-like serine/threonine-protein kinase
MIGQTVSHFEILEKLGEGGMGVVYKARDTHLGRIVALKVLTTAKARDSDRRKRFVQEARSASALNHPNIVTIHEIFQDGQTDFIVMEFVAGKTLDQLIGRRGMRMSEALKYSAQIADALAKAHSAGIVHRDLKPANIMIADDGRAKILDFGLAKLTEPEAHPSQSQATVTRPMDLGAQTEDGIILGTVAYMSPEQAEGRTVDARSDIFAFGAVLYEMLSGRRAFEGPSKMATLSSVIREEPKPFAEVAPSVPREVEKLVARCLRKSVDRRAQHMSDVKLALDELKEDSESGRLAASPASPSPSVKRKRRAWIGVAGLMLVCAIGIWLWQGRLTNHTPRNLALRQLTADDGLTTTPAISSDGRLVAYASDRATRKNLDIWIHPLTQGGQPFRLTRHESDDLDPSFSPDAGLVAFSSDRDGGGIYTVPSLGGEEHLVSRFGAQPRFSPDGKWIVYRTGSYRGEGGLGETRIYLVASGGGPSRRLAPNLGFGQYPIIAPDGKHVLLEGAESVNAPQEKRDWWLAPIDGSPAIKTGLLSPIQNRLGHPSLLDCPGDRIVFSARGNLWEVRFDSSDLSKVQEPHQLTNAAGNATEAAAIQANGEVRIAVAVGTTSAHLWKLRLDANRGKVLGPMQPFDHTGGSQRMPASPANGSALFYRQDDPSGSAVRMRVLSTGVEKTFVTAVARPKPSPDGSQVAYSDLKEGAIYLMSTRGGDASVLLRIRGDRPTIYGWSADGKKIVYWHGNPIRFSLLDLTTRQSATLISHPQRDIHGAELSPDQQWVAFHTPLDRSHPLWIAPVRDGNAAGESEWVKVADSGVQNRRPWWSPDGNLLYFISLLDGFRCIWAQPLDRLSKRPAGQPFAVHHFHSARIRPVDSLGVFGPAIVPDGIIFSLEDETANIWITEAK